MSKNLGWALALGLLVSTTAATAQTSARAEEIRKLDAQVAALDERYTADAMALPGATTKGNEFFKKTLLDQKTTLRTMIVPGNLAALQTYTKLLQTATGVDKKNLESKRQNILLRDQNYRKQYQFLETQLVSLAQEAALAPQLAAKAMSIPKTADAVPQPPEAVAYMEIVNSLGTAIELMQGYAVGQKSAGPVRNYFTESIRGPAFQLQMKLEKRRTEVAHNSKYVSLIDELRGLTSQLLMAADQGVAYTNGPKTSSAPIEKMMALIGSLSQRSSQLQNYLDPSLSKDY